MHVSLSLLVSVVFVFWSRLFLAGSSCPVSAPSKDVLHLDMKVAPIVLGLGACRLDPAFISI